ncbi:MAG: hypothetical protein ACXVCE_11515 [Bacteriovorax sp.]
MKTYLLTAFFSFNFVASSALASSICQYLNDEISCKAHEADGCVWQSESNDTGQCVYEKNMRKLGDIGQLATSSKRN